MPPQTQSFGDVPQGTLAGLGIPLDGKYDGTSSSDLSSGGESDFSETMMH